MITFLHRGLLLSVTLASAGCAVVPIGPLLSTYSDTKATSPRVFASKKTVELATACALNNIENKIASFAPTVGPAPGTSTGREIKARSSEAGMAAVVEIKAVEGGSQISVWISNHYPFKGTLSERIASGC